MTYPEQKQENELLCMAAEGNEKAFTRLVDLYWNKVYSHALAYSKSAPRAQEITQDVFLQVWKKRQKLSEVNDFKNFLFILARNYIVSALRKKLNELTVSETLEGMEELNTPERELEYKQTHNKIMNAIESLPPTRQTVFRMSRIEGLTYEKIAKELNISRNTVKEHIVLALASIRTYLYTHGDILLLVVFVLKF